MAVGLDTMIRIGYSLVIVSVALMIWASSVQAARDDNKKVAPCIFNQMCTCSKASPEDLGIVNCLDVPFASMPRTLNTSKVYMLKLENTGLTEIEPYFLQATGLYRLEISQNPINDIPDDAFNGLERTLWELILKDDELIEIPTKAMRYLQKLRYLDLSGNDISNIERDSFRGLTNSLRTLILSDNSLSIIPLEAFQGLPNLDSLDVSSNNLQDILPDVFREQMNTLYKINLADNLLKEIPYIPLSMLRALRILDLSSNRMNSVLIENESQPLNIKLSLDQLHLEFNQIEIIVPGSFQYFMVVNQTFLDYNPIHMISEDAFQSARIRELYIRNCKVNFIAPTAFSGLESSLQVLDMSGNNITDLPEKIFMSFDLLRSLSLKDNKIQAIFPQHVGFTGFQYSLYKLDISGQKNGAANVQELRKMKNLRSLTVGRLSSSQLAPEEFLDFGVELENLKIIHGGISGIKSHAFMNVRGIKRLDLSENKIDVIERDAFKEIGHSLISLKISHGFSSQVSQLPEALNQLEKLEELVVSNNKIKSMTDTSFHFLKSLKSLEINDNMIETLFKGTFQRDIHSHLEEVSMDFNSLRIISTHTFVDLENLHTIKLKDNRIEKLERRAFMNLDNLKHLTLRGNKLSLISDEAFQNLPDLTTLDLAYNKLRNFDFDFFDQVGTLSTLSVNVSFNKITELRDNSSFISNREHGSAMYHSNIRVLDLSHNNISLIHGPYFKAAEISLTSLDLSHNTLTNTSREVFGNLLHLQFLDLSNNNIMDIDSDTFRNTRKLQVLNLAHNYLPEISYDTFRTLGDLRIVDLSYNNLRSLPDNLFIGDDLEMLDLSHNQLTKIPVTALSNAAALTLCQLDLSNNHIGAIHSMDLSNKFRRLSNLDLSHNRLVRLEDAAFTTLPNLAVLDLSHNVALELFGRVFIGLENTLVELSLENISIYSAPDLPLPKLRVLIISNNELPSIPPELAVNMSSLRVLDLSQNDLTAVPLITHSLPNLRSLSLAGNPITSLSNTSLLGAAETLEHLDIAHFNLNILENGALNKLHCLKSLRLSTYPNLPNFNIPIILENVENLRSLWIESPASKIVKMTSKEGVESFQAVQESASDLGKEMDGVLPPKLKKITISGRGFNRLSEEIFEGVRSVVLHISFHNTSLTSMPSKIFQNTGSVYNISIEINSNNKQLTKIPNPNSAEYPHMPENVLLTELSIDQNSLTCDCDIGWVEFWQRKKRQYFCSEQNNWSDGSYSKALTPNNHHCDELDDEDDLRSAKCINKNNEQLMEVLKTELECGWSGAATEKVNYFIVVGVLTAFVLGLF